METVLELLPKQKDFLQAIPHHKHVAYIGGFGSGKTHVLTYAILMESQKKSYGLVGAPTYRLLSDTTQKKFFEICPKEAIAKFNKSMNKLWLKNGTEIIFRSLDSAEPLTNLDLDWVALDEVGEISIETFRMLQGRLRKPGGSHHCFMVGNPAGPTHWTYSYFVTEAAKYPKAYKLIQATSYENTFTDDDYKETMANSYGRDSLYYKRFMLGMFVAFEGAYWPSFSVEYYPNGHVLKMEDIPKVIDLKAARTGKVVDFGYEHPFVCMWYLCDGKKIIFFDEHFKQHRTIREHCQAIRDKEYEHLNNLKISPCPTAITDHDAQHRAEIENCRDLAGNYIGFGCKLADKEVMPGILLVQALINQNNLYITERCENARNEIPSYRGKPLDKSLDGKEKPIKVKDDTCDCVRMACKGELGHVMDFVRPSGLAYLTNHIDPWEETQRLVELESFNYEKL